MHILSPLGFLYGKIADFRNTLYDRGTLPSFSLGAKTISIGNITTGGTGKTPLVAYVAELLADSGEKVCILTRGYGRESKGRVLVSDGEALLVDARTGGDEPVELARKLIGKAVVVADADRVSAAAWAKDKFGVTAFVLDDAFQHRRVRRDLDIVCVDATDPHGGGSMLPGGRLREPFTNLSRADVVVITRSDLVQSISAISEQIQSQDTQFRVFESRTEIISVTNLGETRTSSPRADWRGLRGHGDENGVRILAFCALGNPRAFFTQVLGAFEDDQKKDEFDLSIMKQFPDHHRYVQSDVAMLEQQARSAGVHALLTTAKDAVKLVGLTFEIPCYVVEIEVKLDDPEAFRDLVLSA